MKLSEAVAGLRSAQVQWALERQQDGGLGTPIGSQHPGQAAVVAVRRALAELSFPAEVSCRWLGSHRAAGTSGHRMTEGRVDVELSFTSPSGVKRAVLVPVMVHEGRVLTPSTFIHDGEYKLISQAVFDDLLDRHTLTRADLDRATMFSPPPDQRLPRPLRPVVRTNLYTAQRAPGVGLVVHSPRVVETTNFSGACKLHGSEAPPEWRAPWCGGHSEELYARYGGEGRRRFIVYPDGPDAEVEVESAGLVPVAKRRFTISVDADGGLYNINDSENRYSHESRFDRDGANAALEVLTRAGLYIGGPLEENDNWEGVPHPEVWADAGFTPNAARAWLPLWADWIDPRYATDREVQREVEEISRWRDTGFHVEEAAAWRSLNLEPKEARRSYSSYGMRAETVLSWARHDPAHDDLDIDLYSELSSAGLAPEDLRAARAVAREIDSRDAKQVARATVWWRQVLDAYDQAGAPDPELEVLSWVMFNPSRRLKFVLKNTPSAHIINETLGNLDDSESPHAFLQVLRAHGIDPETIEATWSATTARGLREELARPKETDMQQHTAATLEWDPNEWPAWTQAALQRAEREFDDEMDQPVPDLEGVLERVVRETMSAVAAESREHELDSDWADALESGALEASLREWLSGEVQVEPPEVCDGCEGLFQPRLLKDIEYYTHGDYNTPPDSEVARLCPDCRNPRDPRDEWNRDAAVQWPHARLVRDVDLFLAGGQRRAQAKGAKVDVLHDTDGTGQVYLVRFADGLLARVSADALAPARR